MKMSKEKEVGDTLKGSRSFESNQEKSGYDEKRDRKSSTIGFPIYM